MSIAQEALDSSARIYLASGLESISSGTAGLNPRKLEAAKRWLDNLAGQKRYRVAIIRSGRLVAEWNHGVARNARIPFASAAKSVFSCMLGINIQEGKIPSADARIIDFYPEALDVPDGEGPKVGRFATK